MKRMSMLAVWAFVSLLGIGSAHAAPCAGFIDVDDANLFCPNVEWLRNRGITLGCTSSTLYCPNDPVSRLAMAAFLQRLGDALLPTASVYRQLTSADLDGLPPSFLPLGTLVCAAPQDLPAAAYPRRAVVDIATSGLAVNGTQGLVQRLAASTNGGAMWLFVGSSEDNRTSGIAPGVYYSMSSQYLYDIPAGQITRFGIHLGRYSSAPASGTDIIDLVCSVRQVIFSRTGASSPFDEAVESPSIRP